GMGHRTTMFVAYAVFTVWMIFAFYKTGFGEGSGQYIGISLLAWSLPYLRLIPMLGRNDYFTFGLTIIPVWFLYIALHEPDSRVLTFLGKTLLFIYAVLLMLLLIFFVAGKDLLPDVSAPAATVGASLSNVWTDIKDVGSGMWDRTAPMFNPTAWQQRINNTFNPKATLYAGQVENNKREPHGVYITKLESLYPKTYIGTTPTILGRIEAKTFIEGGLSLTPDCRLERPKRNGWDGTPDVTPPIIVNHQLVRDVMCTFPVDRNMTPGSYNAYMSVSFDFETWAYITNTFVARDVIAQYRQQGKDINKELDIDPNIEAIYTSGPVSVGMHTTAQPIDVDPDAHTPIQQRFGFTIDDRWEQGEFKNFYSADVLVPEPFELEKCAPVIPSIESQEDGVRTYRFKKNKTFDPRLDLRTVTCQLILPNKEAALSVIGFGEKTPVTFVVIARYEYAVEKKTVLRIEQ
ncbi:hypothetical protein GOV07_04475, partial [Candidatus Woesearchaeota archaeon]|nr:hypothetical protein [Candidatus Woesearchaeota archaeon]